MGYSGIMIRTLVPEQTLYQRYTHVSETFMSVLPRHHKKIPANAPIRAELLSLDRLSAEATAIARAQRVVRGGHPGTTPLLGLISRAAESLNEDNRALAAAARERGATPPAGEWLLDNYYLIEEQVQLVRDDLPADYGIELPRLESGSESGGGKSSGVGNPRIYEALLDLIAHTDSRLDEEAVLRYVAGFQEVSPLSIGEMWAVPIMLRLGLVENVRRLSGTVVAALRTEHAADDWAAAMVAACQEGDTIPTQASPASSSALATRLAALLSDLDRAANSLSPTFFVRLSQRLGELETGADEVNAWLARRLASDNIVLEQVAAESQQEQAANQVSIANSITSIRFLDALDWRAFFEAASLVEAALSKDPTATYAAMDFGSRDRYRHALEIIARRSSATEIEVAEKAVELSSAALAHDASDEVRGHVGWWLIDQGRYELESQVGYRPLLSERLYRARLANRGVFYWGNLTVLTMLGVAALIAYAMAMGALVWQAVVLALIGLIPLSELALVIVNRMSAALFPPRRLPKLDLRVPVTDAHRTLVCVPALLSSPGAARSVAANLEVAYLANRDVNVGFALVADLKAHSEKDRDGDALVLEAAIRAISAINERYEVEHGVRPFHLMVRSRTYNESEDVWMGWERKRGALLELVREMRGAKDTTFSTKLGDTTFRHSCTFVLTLDADTVLPRDGARKLISAIAHPLNRARWTPGEPAVRRGYGLIQPRVGMTLPGSRRSKFSHLYSGQTGIDPYSGAVSDTYQDLFGEGSFTGKGIFEVDVFEGVLEGRFAENSLLSHDLVEGSFLRTGLASDIEILDDYPANYLAAASRTHRWVRGDWQTLPWLGGRVIDARGARTSNPLSRLHRWKITDNLRRSLIAPTTMLLFIFGWLLLPKAELSWPAIMIAIVFFPAYFSLADSMVFRSKSVSFSATVPSILDDFAGDTGRGALSLAVLPHQAWMMTDAIVRALWRMGVSHKKLLEWETAADAEQRAGTSRAAFWRAMGPVAGVSAVLMLLGSLSRPDHLVPALILAAIWLAGPTIAWWVSRPAADSEVGVREMSPLPAESQRVLRRVARKTWRFFDTFVVAEGHALAPDNYQEDPGAVVAWRTSPTNIGLQLLAYANGYDLGFTTVCGLERRVAETLAAMAGLERFRGHFYNWYDIRTLEPLRPMYVSTVDSGNLAGHLLVLRAALLEAAQAPVLGPQLLTGAHDAVLLALEDLVAAQPELNAQDTHAIRETLQSFARAIEVAEKPEDLEAWAALLERLVGLGHDATLAATAAFGRGPAVDGADGAAAIDAAVVSPATTGAQAVGPHDAWSLPPLAVVPATPRDHLAASIADAVRAVREPHSLLLDLVPQLAEENGDPYAGRVPSLAELSAGPSANSSAVELHARLQLAADIAREMWEHTDFSMLYDEHRRLFSIGYNLGEGRLDPSYYDLLASECRLASFLAIAKGDVTQEHWFRLGRALTGKRSSRALVSWSGSMFEYLMPLLVMRDWHDTLLHETYETIVADQIRYGATRGVPWGVSESAFNAKDAQLTYQYQAFGVPGLGLKRGLSDDVVVAPYASMLALPIAPDAVVDNLAAFSAEGGEGRFGYFESLDYTAGRVPAGERRAVVKAYFAHHQGMAFLALGNALLGAKMRARFHDDPMVASAELLLQERIPRHVALTAPHAEEVEHLRSVRELPPPVTRSYATAETPVPATHFLSNGRYSVMVTNGGGGYSRCSGKAVTRYREDLTRDCWGTFFYVRDTATGAVFSAPHNPHPTRPDDYHVVFAPDKAEFHRTDGDLETHVEIAVSPEDDLEVRRVTLTNHGRKERELEVTSYFEIAIATQAADQAHKSFSNLFVETEWLPETNALIFSRRPRSASESREFGLHLVACESAAENGGASGSSASSAMGGTGSAGASVACGVSYETDRAAFLGRLHGADDPVAVSRGGELGGTVGAVLDPCAALRRTVTVPPGESMHLVFATGVAETREAALMLSEKYADIRSAQRAIDLAWTAAQLELRDLGISPAEAVVLERLASRLVLTDPYSPLKRKTPVENGLQMSGLWSIGVSGDLPILLVRVEELEHAPLVRQALLAHQYWRHKGLVTDLVILNTRPSGYSDALDDRLRLLVRTGHALQMLDKPGGVFLRRVDQMHTDVANLLVGVARATLDGDAGPIELQLNRRGKRPAVPDALVPKVGATLSAGDSAEAQAAFKRPELLFDNTIGGFDAQTGEYVIVLEGDEATPAPWINALASPQFGCTVSEAGVGCTWALNSHENRITTWNNDPVSDGSGEAIYIRDEETGEFWSPTPLPVRTPEPYVIRHGFGRTSFEHETHGIAHKLDWFLSAEDPMRVCRLGLTNTGDRARSLSITQFIEWVVGDSRSRAQQLVVTWMDTESETLTAHNHFNLDFPGRCSFLACDQPLSGWTASRTEFVGRNRTPAHPAAMGRKHLGEVSGRYHDNCGALQTLMHLEPGETREVSFLLGQAPTLEDSRVLVERYRRAGACTEALAGMDAAWDDLLCTVQVRTPDPKLDLLLNGRLLYQVTACRLWGRTATYQSSGAYGFRDQLQDVMALLVARPDLVREQIVEASRHQFPEGDVLHWWQPFSGRGVRTHITDDRHWLALVVAEYLSATGDTALLDERTPFIEGPLLPQEAEDAYLTPPISEQTASVYEHCIRALETGRPTGANGLPLIGGADWNDGMNRVGHEGRGESVWLAWFLIHTLRRFAPVCKLRGDAELAADYLAWADRLAAAVEATSWDGAWYRRGYFDDGTPLGTHDAAECRIDAIAQAWATISGAANPKRAAMALESVEEKLIRREDGLIALLTPPFDRMEHDPGYIKGYVPGVRENGGQYTHAALWVVLAYLLRGDGDEAWGLLDLINPISHATTHANALRYAVEPYVVAADVYAVAPHTGRGGWTWYTGSASWFYRVALESLLGFSTESRNGVPTLRINPCIPKDWPTFDLDYRFGATHYRIRVDNPRGVNRGVARVTVDGFPDEDLVIRLVDDGDTHNVVVTLLGG